jgi:hypothetical protein
MWFYISRQFLHDEDESSVGLGMSCILTIACVHSRSRKVSFWVNMRRLKKGGGLVKQAGHVGDKREVGIELRTSHPQKPALFPLRMVIGGGGGDGTLELVVNRDEAVHGLMDVSRESFNVV